MNAIVLSPAGEPRTEAVSTPTDLLALAVRQGADLDKLERLMELKARWEADEARKAFTAAMTKFKAEPISIRKAKHVEFRTRDGDVTSYNHAELSDITDAIGPALAKHELSYRWDIRQEGSGITVVCILTHVNGHSEQVTMSAPPDASGKKNAIQQVASTTTYLQRYTLLALTGMSTKGMDDDGRASGQSSSAKGARPTEPEDTPERLALYARLQDIASTGVAAYAEAWGKLKREQRQLIGASGHETLKSIAESSIVESAEDVPL